MKDYTQENYDRLCAALTMDELANFMDCIPFGYESVSIRRLKLKEYDTLVFCMSWHLTKQGSYYWKKVHERLEANEA